MQCRCSRVQLLVWYGEHCLMLFADKGSYLEAAQMQRCSSTLQRSAAALLLRSVLKPCGYCLAAMSSVCQGGDPAPVHIHMCLCGMPGNKGQH
jgi:hypothetical protein